MEAMIRKIFFLVVLIFSVLCFTSCLDYVQTISYKNGKYHFYYKVTVSKLLMEMGDGDSDSFVEELQADLEQDFPDFVEAKVVNTELEAGMEVSFDISPKTTEEDEKEFLPKKMGNKYIIPFMIGSEMAESNNFDSMDSEAEGLTKAILSSAKIRVMIGKNIVPVINIAYFEGEGGENCVIPVFDYGENFCLEIPLITLFEDLLYDFENIILM